MKVLSEFPSGPRSAKGFSKYDRMLDGKVYEFVVAEEFPEASCIETLRSSMKAAAHSKGMKLRTSYRERRTVMIVQAYKPEAK